MLIKEELCLELFKNPNHYFFYKWLISWGIIVETKSQRVTILSEISQNDRSFVQRIMNNALSIDVDERVDLHLFLLVFDNMTQLFAIFAVIFIVTCVGFRVSRVMIFWIWFEMIGLIVSFILSLAVFIAIIGSWYKNMWISGWLNFWKSFNRHRK